ncbi:Telomere length regulation protein ELG1 [Pseudozyma hubeiensis]|nr:Telomere length regulation protein ELG1 [Pseudozyma hubeiensis]
MSSSTSSSLSPSPSVATSGDSIIAAPTQQSDASSAPEPAGQGGADLAKLATTAAPTSSSETPSKPLPPLHPFFTPGELPPRSIDSNDGSDTDQKRPSRSSRAKAPISYREDLKAVLRADAAQESARLKDEKKQAQLQVKEAKKALRQPRKSKVDQPNLNSSQDTDGFELVETRVGNKPEQQSHASTSSSSSRPHQPPKLPESKPLSLAVKGNSTAASANPHPFFTKKPKQQPLPPTEASTTSNETAEDADKASSLSADRKGKAPATASSSAFSSTPASWSLFASQRTASSKPKKPTHAPWPTSEDTHVAALDDNESERLSRARTDLAAFRSRWQASPMDPATQATYEPPPLDFVARLNGARPQPHLDSILLTGSDEFKSTDDFVGQAKTEGLSQIAVAFAEKQAQACRTSGQMWTDAFRPHAYHACLGNESAASYLEDWLRHLLVAAPGSVTTTDRKRKHGVQRRVDRTKRRKARRAYSDDDDDDGMADFIVDDDEEEDAVGEYDDSIADDEWFGKFSKIDRTSTLADEGSVDGLESSQTTATSAAAAPSPAAPDADPRPQGPYPYPPRHAPSNRHPGRPSLDRLTNCMILTGPGGSGKTASVYACATQLGYEVFELYPGMGKRSGKELLAAVGDLGRNHMVSSGGVGGGATFKRSQPIPSTSASASTTASSSTNVMATTTVRQSLILIEEADVLFEEDKGFWSAVVELVAESKRPIVIVCNELDLVPVQDLPVQDVLRYRKPDVVEEVVPWLQTVAAEMGRFVVAEEVEAMVLDLPGTESALGMGEETRADLRQALNQMQFGHLACVSSPSEEAQHRAFIETQAAKQASMKAIASAAESSSLADVLESALERGDGEEYGDAGVEGQASSRQLGSWVQLVPQPLGWWQQRQALAGGVHVEYRSALADVHALLGAKGVPSMLHQELHEFGGGKVAESLLTRLREHQGSSLRRMVAPLGVARGGSAILPPWLVVEYAPMIRLMALVDADLAQIHTSLQQQQQQQQEAEADSNGVAAAPATRGRSTRNSSRALTSWLGIENDYGYERWLAALGPEEVNLARQTNLTF